MDATPTRSDTSWIGKMHSDSNRLTNILAKAQYERTNLTLRLLLLEAGALAAGLTSEIEFGLKQRKSV